MNIKEIQRLRIVREFLNRQQSKNLDWVRQLDLKTDGTKFRWVRQLVEDEAENRNKVISYYRNIIDLKVEKILKPDDLTDYVFTDSKALYVSSLCALKTTRPYIQRFKHDLEGEWWKVQRDLESNHFDLEAISLSEKYFTYRIGVINGLLNCIDRDISKIQQDLQENKTESFSFQVIAKSMEDWKVEYLGDEIF